MTDQPAHTPLPWKASNNTILGPDRTHVAECHGPRYIGASKEVYALNDAQRERENADAVFIVKAVNQHDVLVAVLRGLIGWASFARIIMDAGLRESLDKDPVWTDARAVLAEVDA